jgi:hypothetical protein
VAVVPLVVAATSTSVTLQGWRSRGAAKTRVLRIGPIVGWVPRLMCRTLVVVLVVVMVPSGFLASRLEGPMPKKAES